MVVANFFQKITNSLHQAVATPRDPEQHITNLFELLYQGLNLMVERNSVRAVSLLGDAFVEFIIEEMSAMVASLSMDIIDAAQTVQAVRMRLSLLLIERFRPMVDLGTPLSITSRGIGERPG